MLEIQGSIRALRALVVLWCRRARSRHELRKLGSRQLHDIGADWAEARREAAKPFWRA